MNVKRSQPIDLAKADELLKAWRKKHDTPEKAAAAHRKVLLERVVESMAFEREPVEKERRRFAVDRPELRQ